MLEDIAVDDVDTVANNCDTVVEPVITAIQQFNVNMYVPADKVNEPQLKNDPLVSVVVAVNVDIVTPPILFNLVSLAFVYAVFCTVESVYVILAVFPIVTPVALFKTIFDELPAHNSVCAFADPVDVILIPFLKVDHIDKTKLALSCPEPLEIETPLNP